MVQKTIIILLVIFAVFSHWNVAAQSSTSAARTICIRNCGNGPSDPQCATNGVTYGNQCLFNCAKARNPRLRVAKNGSCARTTLSEYRGTSRTSSSRNSWFKK